MVKPMTLNREVLSEVKQSTPEILAEADDAVEYAIKVRLHHANKTRKGSPQRAADIRVAKLKLHHAMFPIRRILCNIPYKPTDFEQELKEASFALQRERRKLWKLLRGTKRRPKKPKRKRGRKN
jgi:hypothetical protein